MDWHDFARIFTAACLSLGCVVSLLVAGASITYAADPDEAAIFLGFTAMGSLCFVLAVLIWRQV